MRFYQLTIIIEQLFFRFILGVFEGGEEIPLSPHLRTPLKMTLNFTVFKLSWIFYFSRRGVVKWLGVSNPFRFPNLIRYMISMTFTQTFQYYLGRFLIWLSLWRVVFLSWIQIVKFFFNAEINCFRHTILFQQFLFQDYNQNTVK